MTPTRLAVSPYGGHLNSVAARSARSGSAPATVEEEHQDDDRNRYHRTHDEPDPARPVAPVNHARGLLLA